jgi:hypothetical protein
MMNWLLKNSLLGTVLTIFFGENWLEEKPQLAVVVKVILLLILLLTLMGFVVSLFD